MAKSKNEREKEKTEKKKIDIDIDIETDDKATVNASVEKSKESAKTTKKESSETGECSGEEKNDVEITVALNAVNEALTAEKDKYLRLAAEYDNFRKRSAKERETTYSNAKADIIGKLLPVYDNLERAIKMECSDKAYFKGVEMTMMQLKEILKNMGVNPIPTVGEPFDPNLHNAVLRIEDSNLGEGVVAEECLKGFTVGERVIRFSDVVVAN